MNKLKEIKREVVKYYKKLFEDGLKQRLILEGLDLKKLKIEEARYLIELFEEEEIGRVI